MKKIIMLIVTAMLVVSFAGCGKQENNKGASDYESPVELLTALYDSYGDDEKFPVGGGDSDHITMDAPGKFDISNTVELDMSLGLPEHEAGSIDAAASMVHMMNANIFTGAAYHLTENADMDQFVDAVEENILSRQWICGRPDMFIIADAGSGYVLTAFGEDSVMQTFKEKAESLGLEIILEEAVAE